MSKHTENQRLRRQVDRMREINAEWQQVARELADINEIQRIELATIYGEQRMPLFQRLGDHELPLPARGTSLSAGFDLRACVLNEHGDPGSIHLFPQQVALIDTGWAVDVGSGHGGVILPRSGRGHKDGLVLGNLVGLIDADYSDELKVSAWNRNTEGPAITIHHGDRIAQLVVVPINTQIAEEVAELPNKSAAREGGFGSTGTS